MLRIADKTFESHLFTGTGKFAAPEVMVEAIRASGSQLVTLAMKRVDLQGASAGIVGALLGAVLGALLASQLNNLMPIIGAFLDGAALPVAIEPLQVIVIALVAMVLALLSTLYPSWRAAATQPAEALRYE